MANANLYDSQATLAKHLQAVMENSISPGQAYPLVFGQYYWDPIAGDTCDALM